MKNSNLIQFQNGFLTALSIIDTQLGKAERKKESSYMYRNTDGYYYFDKGAYYPEYGYTGKTYNYQILGSACVWDDYGGKKPPEPYRDKIVLIYFSDYDIQLRGSGNEYMYYFYNYVEIYFNTVEEAIECLKTGNYDKTIGIRIDAQQREQKSSYYYKLYYSDYSHLDFQTRYNPDFYYSSVEKQFNTAYHFYTISIIPIE